MPCQAKKRLYLTDVVPEQGETVPYIICVELDDNGQQKESTGGLADRAYHRDELAANPNLRVDVEYYLANQVHSSLQLLLECSQGSPDQALQAQHFPRLYSDITPLPGMSSRS